MKLEKEYLEDHQVRVSVEVDSEVFEGAKHRAARKMSKRTKIPGFRPGKAPYPVILRHVGEAAIIDEAIEILVNDIYSEVIDEAEIDPYGPGTLEDIPSLDPLKLDFLIPLQATVELGDYKSVRVPYDLKEITEDDIDVVTSNLRERQAVIEPVERAAQAGDLVDVTINASLKEPDEGQNPTLFENRSLPILVLTDDDEDTSEEWPFPGFSGNLVGLSPGEETTLEHDFPEDSKYEALQGVDAKFFIHIDKVRSRTLPNLDDEFAKSLGEYETVDELRSEIRSELEEQERRRYNSEYDNQVLDEIVEMSTIEYPPQMLEREIDNVIQRMEVDLQQQNLDIDLYLKTQQIDMDGLREEVTPVAQTRIQKSLTLIELSEAEGITVENEELQAETTRTLEQYSQYLSEQDFKNILRDDNRRTDLVGNIMMDMLTSRTNERIRNIARGLEIGEDGAVEENVESETSSPDLEDTPVDVDIQSEKEGRDTQGKDHSEVEENLDASEDPHANTPLTEEKTPEEETYN